MNCFIPKWKNDNFPNELLSRSRTDEEVRSEILNQDNETIVYFSGTIAPPQYGECGYNGFITVPVYVPGTNIIMDYVQIPKYECEEIHKCYDVTI